MNDFEEISALRALVKQLTREVDDWREKYVQAQARLDFQRKETEAELKRSQSFPVYYRKE